MVFYFSDRFSPEHGPIFGKLFMQSLDVSLIEVSLFNNLCLSLILFPYTFSAKIVPLPVRIIPFLIGSNCFRSLFSLSPSLSLLFSLLSFYLYVAQQRRVVPRIFHRSVHRGGMKILFVCPVVVFIKSADTSRQRLAKVSL